MEAADLLTNSRYILKHIEDAAVELNFELPARRYVTVGGSVFDCEQVTVSTMTSNTGVVSPSAGALDVIGPCPPVWNAAYEAAIVLCASEAVEGPRGTKLPPVEKVEADASNMSTAYAIIVNAVDAIAGSGDVGSISCVVTFGQPQGGLIAVVATITANLWVPGA